MYPFVCGITYYNEYEHDEITVYNLLYAASFAEAMNQIEEVYRDDMISCNIHAVAESGSLFEVTADVATALVKGMGIMSDAT